MKEQKIIFVGESHTHAVIDALKRYSDVPAGVNVVAHRLTRIKNGTLIGTLNYDDLLLICDYLSEDDLVVSLIGGNQHSMISLIQHDSPFDVFEPFEDISNLIPSAEIVPRAGLLSFFYRGLRANDARRIKEIGARGKHRTIHLAAPPPKADTAHIMRRFEAEFEARGLREKGISPARLRAKIWRLQNEALAAILAEDDIDLLMPPDGTMTTDGFLLPEYYAADATHANAIYGAHIIEQVLRFSKFATPTVVPGA